MPYRQLARVVLFVSAGMLGFEIALMRILQVVSWHYFAFLVISLVMLGFGASGTLLTVFEPSVRGRVGPILRTLVPLTGLTMAISVGLAQRFPLEWRMVPAIWLSQLATCLAHWALLSIPFFLGGAAVCVSLMAAGSRTPLIYAYSFLGSAVGAVLPLVLMYFVPPRWLGPLMAVPVFLGMPGLQLRDKAGRPPHPELPGSDAGGGARARPFRFRPAVPVVWIAAVLVAAGFVMVIPPRLVVDRYKYGAYVGQLAAQGRATRAGVAYSPRALVEAYRGETFHQLPFLTGGEMPPAVAVLLADGHYAGSVLDANTVDEASVVRNTLPAVAYALAPPQPRVALLGESGGVNVWLALRNRARSIDVVQPDRKLSQLIQTALADHGGAVFDAPPVRTRIAEPRHFVETRDAGGPAPPRTGRVDGPGPPQTGPAGFDLIQFVGLEGSAVGSHGLGGLGEERLFTVEGVRAALELLSPEGVLSITRGIQTPPRDNFRIFATAGQALREAGVSEPAAHVVVVRDFLAVCTVVRATPWTDSQIRRLREVIGERSLTPVWFPGVRADELNQPDAMEEPPGTAGDWYHLGARRLLGPRAEAFAREWPFDIRPPTDDRPYFLNFFKAGAFGELKAAYGDQWLTRVELAFPLVLIAMVIITGVGALLTLAPLLVAAGGRGAAERAVDPERSGRRAGVAGGPGPPRTGSAGGLRGCRGGRAATVVYFGSIGLAYLLLEMLFLSRLTYWIGDPVTTAAVVISSFLVMSGLGSMTAQYLLGRVSRPSAGSGSEPRTSARADGGSVRWRMLFFMLVVIAAVDMLVLRSGAGAVASAELGLRTAASFLVVAPLAFLMGFPMSLALMRLQEGAARLVPWAWGINGFASVLAAPLAVALSMQFGFRLVGIVAIGLYAVAGATFAALPSGRRETVENERATRAAVSA